MNKFIIRHPPCYSPERQYAIAIAFGRHFGVPYELVEEHRRDISICVAGDETNKSLTLPDVLFQTLPTDWVRTNSMPQEPLHSWMVSSALISPITVNQRIPIVYGQPLGEEFYRDKKDSPHYLGIDVFGSLFFMLTRYEEAVGKRRDNHDRFPATSSLAFREGFLERPIVNEYLELLWTAIKRLWPQIRRKEIGPARILLSHDVDYPTCTQSIPTLRVLKSCIGDVVKRHDAMAALRRISARAIGEEIGWKIDPANTFDFLMDCSETIGLCSEFNFIPESSEGEIDGNYDLESPGIRRLMRTIHARGHGIGYHGSYLTYRDADLTHYEVKKLKRVASEEGIVQDQWHGRQHYLRWMAPVTWQIWQDAGLYSDSSVGFADRVGFRSGYCQEYPVFNLNDHRQLKLLERPLIAMDQTLVSYMALAWPDIVEKILSLWQTCRIYGGDFTMLWHNSSLISKQSKQWYQEILRNLYSSSASTTAA